MAALDAEMDALTERQLAAVRAAGAAKGLPEDGGSGGGGGGGAAVAAAALAAAAVARLLPPTPRC